METKMLVMQSDRKEHPTALPFRAMTRAEVLALSYGDHVWIVLLNGRVGEVKINGKVRTWKRDPDRVEVSVRRGMYEYATLSMELALEQFVVPVEVQS